jgi:elongation factor G
VLAGDIGATLGLKDSFTGETLCSPSAQIVLESIAVPEPVISVAIEPKTTADQDKMSEALRRLSEEDPTFRVRTDETTGQTLISGMGELHLEIALKQLNSQVAVAASTPRVVYRESVSGIGINALARSPNKRNSFVILIEPLKDGGLFYIRPGFQSNGQY